MWEEIQNDSLHIRKELMHVEWARLKTFSCFHFTMDVSIIQLARAGFFLSGHNCVTCYSCDVTRTSWEDNENPMKYHQRVSPTCNILLGLDSKNIPIARLPDVEEEPEATGSSNNSVDNTQISNEFLRSDFLENRSDRTEHQETRRNQSCNTGSEVLEGSEVTSQNYVEHEVDQQLTSTTTSHPVGRFSVNFSKPKYPAYAVLSSREDTFASWPQHLPQTREQMARAGFIFTGYADYTRCFFCGGGLRNWEPGDDPWTEHARWFPRCMYLLQNKGEDFVRTISQASSASAENTNSSSGGAADKQKSQSDTSTNMWKLAAVQTLLDTGHNREMIERAVNSLVKHKSLCDIEAVELLEEVFRIQEADDSSQFPSPVSIRETNSPVPREISSDSEEAETQLLMIENRKLKDMSLCKVCGDTEVAIVFLPCGHFVCCSQCAPAMTKCPACKVIIQASVKAFLV